MYTMIAHTQKRERIPLLIIFCTIACIINFYGCRYAEPLPSAASPISISPQLVNNDLSLSNFVDSVTYLCLNTQGKGAIGAIQKVIFHQKYIFVLDKFYAKSVYIFHTDGSFVAQVGQYGRGPGEFQSPFDIAVDPYNETIDIYANEPRGSKILKFDYEGRFVSELVLDYYCSGLTVYDKDTYLIYRYNYSHGIPQLDHHLLWMSQRTGEIIDAMLPYRIKFSHAEEPGAVPDQIFSQHRNGFSFMYWNADTVYLVDPPEVVPWYYFHFEGFEFDKEKPISTVEALREVMKDPKEVCCLSPVINMPDFIYFRFITEDVNGIRGLYSKSKRKTRLFREIENDFNGMRFFLPRGNIGNQLIIPIPALELKQTFKYHPAPESLRDYKALKVLTDTLNEVDNDVLMIYHIKDW